MSECKDANRSTGLQSEDFPEVRRDKSVALVGPLQRLPGPATLRGSETGVLVQESSMFKLLLVTPLRDSFAGLASALRSNEEVELSWAESGVIALAIVTDTPVDLVVVDEFLGDMTGLEFAERMLSVNPMINCAAVSPLSPKQFHEASEGLGLLAQVPAVPHKEHAEKLLQRLKEVKGLVAGA